MGWHEVQGNCTKASPTDPHWKCKISMRINFLSWKEGFLFQERKWNFEIREQSVTNTQDRRHNQIKWNRKKTRIFGYHEMHWDTLKQWNQGRKVNKRQEKKLKIWNAKKKNTRFWTEAKTIKVNGITYSAGKWMKACPIIPTEILKSKNKV